MANERLSLFIKPAVSRWLLLAHKKQIDKKGKPMSQVAQTPQKFTLPGMHKRITPAPLEKQREGRVWLHPFTRRFFIKPPPEPPEPWTWCSSFWEPKAWW